MAQKKNRFLKKRDPRHGRTPQQYQDFILTPSSDFTNFNLDFKADAIADFLHKALGQHELWPAVPMANRRLMVPSCSWPAPFVANTTYDQHYL